MKRTSILYLEKIFVLLAIQFDIHILNASIKIK